MVSRAASIPHPRERLGVATIGALALLVYMVVVGGTDSGAVQPALIAITSVAGGALIAYAIFLLRSGADRLDIGIAFSVGLFSITALFSDFPRQSFDVVLAGLAYLSGLVVARRMLCRDAARRFFALMLMALSLAFTVGVAVVWGGLIGDWLAGADAGILPPLDMQLSSSPWGYRFDLVLLVVLLYPAWWAGDPGLNRRVLATLVGVVVIALVLVSGSRTLWLALVIASVAVAAPLAGSVLRSGRAAGVALIAAAMLLLATWVTGVLPAFVQRALSIDSLSYRLAMWEPLTELWLSEPLTGFGPGSFPWLLQLTSYFEGNGWAPRHPDSPFIQLLVEAGLLGLVAAAIAVAAVLLPLLRSQSHAAKWAIFAFAAASVGTNPTDFSFLLVVVIGWVAYAVPYRRTQDVRQTPRIPGRARWLVWPAFGGLLLVSAVQGAHVAASFAHQSAGQAAGDHDAATASLDLAVALDPGMALYRRDRATAAYLDGDLISSAADLQHAARINPADDVTWRTLAIVQADLGRSDASETALARALQLRRTDPVNLLVAAVLADRRQDAESALDHLVELVQAHPMIVGAEGWGGLADGRSERVLRAALDRWREGATRLSSVGQEIFLAAVLEPDAFGRPSESHPLVRAAALTLRCDLSASELLKEVPVGDRRWVWYAEVRVRDSANRGDLDRAALRAFQVHVGYPDHWFDTDATDNALADSRWWGYRRLPAFWSAGLALPSPLSGGMRWMLDPAEAVEEAGLQQLLPECR